MPGRDLRILFQPPNTIGLGHISRLLGIALAARDQICGCKVLFAIEGESHGLLEAYDLPYIAVPSLRANSGNWSQWSTGERMSLNVGIARAVLDAAKPDVIVFDCFPHRAFAQLALTYNLPFVMCVREMKETAGYYQILRPVLDAARLILIPHDNNGPSFPEWLTHKAKCVGQIVRPAPSSSRPSRLATSRPLIVISGGGGGFPDTVDFYNLTLHAFKLCQQEVPECTGALVTGPLFRSWDRLLPVEGIRILPFEPNMLGLFATADLVLCQAGYNTVAELGTMNVPTICIPARRDYDDQFERANSLSKSNPLFEMHTESDPASLALRMTRMIAQGRGSVGTTVTSGTVPDGAYRAAFSLLEGWK